MNRLHIQWSCAVVAAFLVTAASADPPTHKFNNRTYGNWVFAGSCSDFDNGYRCREVHVWKNYDVKGTYEYTEVWFYNDRHEWNPNDGSEDHRWRYVTCPVDEKSIAAHPSHATIDLVLDTEAPECEQWGERYGKDSSGQEYWQPWEFSGIWVFEGEWLDPFSHGSSSWNGQYKNYQYDGWIDTVYRDQGVVHCKDSWGDAMTRGGWSVTPPSGRTFFYEFSGPNGPVASFYSFSSCNDNNMQK